MVEPRVAQACWLTLPDRCAWPAAAHLWGWGLYLWLQV